MVNAARLLFGAAAASYGTNHGYSVQNVFQGKTHCAIDSFDLNLPAALGVAPSESPSYVGLAFGVQNYTCSSSNNYTSVGAVAELIDVSCYVHESWFDGIETDLYNVWTSVIHYPIQAITSLLSALKLPDILSQHYFIPNPVTGQGLSPKWDFTSSGKLRGNKNAFIVGAGNGTAPAPTDPAHNIPWLRIVNVEGKVADTVYRIDTVGGQPPSSCKSGESPDISVKYVSLYVFYGGSL